MSERIKLSILGSTGSIGRQALDLVEENPELYDVVALSCNADIGTMISQIDRHKPKYVVVGDRMAYEALKKDCPSQTSVLFGVDGLCTIAELDEVDIVLTSVVGNIGLRPTVAAVKAGKRIALANKETLVTAGALIMPMVKEYGAEIIPVDSEHSAIFQSIQGSDPSVVEKVILTASGGPFRGRTRESLSNVTASEALKHPNWSMGRKISIDSSTLMNKGLEVIEAKWLFDLEPSQVEVVVHPESIIHSMAVFKDSAVIAQLGVPDMRLPIWYAFHYPDRMPNALPRLDFSKIMSLNFDKPDLETFPCLGLAYDALHIGGILPTVLNASNEVLVEAFLNGYIGFYDIPRVIEKMMAKADSIPSPDLEDILHIDTITRIQTKEIIQ